MILPYGHVGEEPMHGALTRVLGTYLRAGLEEYLARNAQNSKVLSTSPYVVWHNQDRRKYTIGI